MGLKIFHKIFYTFIRNHGILTLLLSVPYNIVMDMKMLCRQIKCYWYLSLHLLSNFVKLSTLLNGLYFVIKHVLARRICGALSFVVGYGSLYPNGLSPLSLKNFPIMHLHCKCWTCLSSMCSAIYRATSHMRLRARDHYTPSTLIGEKGRAGPSSLHTTLKRSMEYVNARWV